MKFASIFFLMRASIFYLLKVRIKNKRIGMLDIK